MIINWKSMREECPMAIQVIEMKTGFKYDPAYHTLINDKREMITFPIVEGFFDNQGWFLSVWPLKFPNWGGFVKDSQDNVVWSDPDAFALVLSRNHAKSLIVGIIMKCFEEQLKGLMVIPEGATMLVQEHLEMYSRGKFLEHVTIEDLNLDGKGLLQNSAFCYLKMDKQALVLKNERELPFVGMILPL